MLKYFAYGSNLHPVRLKLRVPESEFVCCATLKGYQLCFHKRAGDGSSKCNVLYTGDDTDIVHGAIYQLPKSLRHVLDRYEGVGFGYEVEDLEVSAQGETHKVFAYVAQDTHIDDGMLPYHWYKELVVKGAEHHDLPQQYIDELYSIDSAHDLEDVRRRENERIVSIMRDYPPE